MLENGRSCGPCYHCKSDMWLPNALYDAAKHSDRITFYCAYGHPQVFAQGESDFDKLRRERDMLKQQMAFKDSEIARERGRAEAAADMLKREKAATAKARKRTKAGTCPCCNRTFRQMALHMKNKHPEYAATERGLLGYNTTGGEAA